MEEITTKRLSQKTPVGSPRVQQMTTPSRLSMSATQLSTATPPTIRQSIAKLTQERENKNKDLADYKILFDLLGMNAPLVSYRTVDEDGIHALALAELPTGLKFFVQINTCNKECNSSQLEELRYIPVTSQNDGHKLTAFRIYSYIINSGLNKFYPEIGLVYKDVDGLLYKVFVKGEDTLYSIYDFSLKQVPEIKEGEYYVLILSSHLDQVIVEDKEFGNVYTSGRQVTIKPEVLQLIGNEVTKYYLIIKAQNEKNKLVEVKNDLDLKILDVQTTLDNLNLNIQDPSQILDFEKQLNLVEKQIQYISDVAKSLTSSLIRQVPRL